MTTSSLPSIASWVRLPDPSNGTMPSLSPWITSVGTVTLGRSSRKSVVPKASMHPSAASWLDCLHSAIACWRCSSVTLSSSPALKNCVMKSSKNASRSSSRPLRIPSAASSVSGPSGLSSVLSRYGGTAAANTTLCSRSSPCRDDVARHLAAAHREADQRDVGQVEVGEHVVEVVGERVVVVAVARVGLAEAATVVGHDAVAGLLERRGSAPTRTRPTAASRGSGRRADRRRRCRPRRCCAHPSRRSRRPWSGRWSRHQPWFETTAGTAPPQDTEG